MKVKFSSLIYDNPLPQLRSRQAAFPFLAELDDGTILAAYQIGEAFESVDGTSYISKSTDGGKTWSGPYPMFDKSGEVVPITDCCKVTSLGGGKLVGIGYEYDRTHPEWPIGNPQTGGLIDDRVYITRSHDNGQTWSAHEAVPNHWGPHTEASAPITVLKNGDADIEYQFGDSFVGADVCLFVAGGFVVVRSYFIFSFDPMMKIVLIIKLKKMKILSRRKKKRKMRTL